MELGAKIWKLFSVSEQSDALNRAQADVLSRQVPAFYAVLIFNTIALCYTHFAAAPRYLTVIFPSVLVVLAIVRGIVHIRNGRRKLSNAAVQKKLQVTIFASFVVGILFCTWSTSLFPYGDAFLQGHVISYTAITTLGVIGCLLPLRSASVTATMTFFVPIISFLLLTGNLVYMAIAATLVATGIVTTMVAFGYAKDFSTLIDFQGALLTKEAEARELSERNFKYANSDNLTGLANRRSFFSTLKTRLQTAEERKAALAVGVLDLDGFKLINDIHGHVSGDQLLIEVGRRLREVLDESVFVARLGGDEFGLIVPSDRTGVQLEGVGGKIVAALKTPFQLGDSIVKISGSVGFACYPEDNSSAEELYEHADYALYHAKDVSVGETVFFTRELRNQIQELNKIRRCLRDADLEAEMEPHFQFLFSVEAGQFVGAESLARWKSPELGFVAPDAFIRVAEQSGLINKLTVVLFKKTLLAALEWPKHVRVTFNLSSHDIGSSECISQLISTINELDFDARRLVFEVTESAVMGNFEKAREFLEVLKVTGAQIALDDFGTGYSSLSYVRNLPLDALKIDRSFVKGIEQDDTAKAVMRTFVDLSRNLNLKCVIEGVETEAQLEVLIDLGCTYIQGYLFCKPMTQADAYAFLASQTQIPDMRNIS